MGRSNHKARDGLTINVPVVYLAQEVMILMTANMLHYKGHWKGWALKIETFLGPEMASECHLDQKSLRSSAI